MTLEASERELTDIVYQVALTLVKRDFLTNAGDFTIQREGMDEVTPLGTVGSPGRIDLSQLEDAAKHGKFWFSGPITGLRVAMREPRLGTLDLEMAKMSFTTTLNSLNYKDFEVMTERLRQLSDELRLTLSLGKGAETYEEILVISSSGPLSPPSLGDFLDKTLLLIDATESL